MNPHPSEEELALFAGGDLYAGGISRVREHLLQCPECRETAERVGHSMDFLQQTAEAIPLREQDLADVRGRVRAHLRRTHGAPARWKWLPVPAAICLGAIWLWRAQAPKLIEIPAADPLMSQVAIPPRSFPELVALPGPTPPLVRRHMSWARAGVRSVALVTRPGQAPVIRIATADPSVVVLLSTDERTSSDE
jgi:hypothetical protein